MPSGLFAVLYMCIYCEVNQIHGHSSAFIVALSLIWYQTIVRDYKLGQPLEYTNLNTLLCVGQITICLTCVRLALLIMVSCALCST